MDVMVKLIRNIHKDLLSLSNVSWISEERGICLGVKDVNLGWNSVSEATCHTELSSTLNLKLGKSNTADAAAAKSLQSRPTLCDPIDGSPPGSSVPGILQARTLERVAI